MHAHMYVHTHTHRRMPKGEENHAFLNILCLEGLPVKLSHQQAKKLLRHNILEGVNIIAVYKGWGCGVTYTHQSQH